MDTSNLIISEAPAAFAEFAAKHNALVNLIAKMSGTGGIDVKTAEANIIIGLNKSTAGVSSNKVYTTSVTVAGVVPTAAEFTTALQAIYAVNTPANGDIVNLTVSGTVRFRSVTTKTNPGSGGIFNVSFTNGGATFYGMITQVGIY